MAEVRSAEIAAILSQLNDELGRLSDSESDVEACRVVLVAYDAIGKIRATDVALDRMDQFNGAGGAISWGRRSFEQHPDRCTCQAGDSIPHRHYDHAPYRCARCSCAAYQPECP